MAEQCLRGGRVVRSHSWSGLDGNAADSSKAIDPPSAGTKASVEAWTLGDCAMPPTQRLPLASFNHIAREVLNLEKSKAFYVDILGFEVGPRPPFDSDGYWLFGYGLSLHLVLTTQPESRKLLRRERIKYFTSCLPRVDHTAFITSDISVIRKTLEERKVYYKEDKPKNTGIEQIFFFDPDGNVIEVSNCARIEQACTLAVQASLSRRPSADSLLSPSQQEPFLPRIPSHVYINGDTIVSSPLPAIQSLAIDAAVSAAVSPLSSILQQQQQLQDGAESHTSEKYYYFCDSFDADDELPSSPDGDGGGATIEAEGEP